MMASMQAEPIYDTDEEDGPMLFGRELVGMDSGRRISWAEAQAWKPGASGEVL